MRRISGKVAVDGEGSHFGTIGTINYCYLHLYKRHGLLTLRCDEEWVDDVKPIEAAPWKVMRTSSCPNWVEITLEGP